MSSPQKVLKILEALFLLGMEACEDIEQFKPDLLIGLTHSAWMPMLFTRMLWQEIHDTPCTSFSST